MIIRSLRSIITKSNAFNGCKFQHLMSSSLRLKSDSHRHLKEIESHHDNKHTNVQSKYQIFKDESEVILDVYDETRSTQYSYNLPEREIETNMYEGLNLNRGVNGVFDVEDLIDVLRREQAQDIFVARVPKNVQYVDYMCIVSCKSMRHIQALTQLVRRVYKMKKAKGDIIPKLEGANSKDWQALDLGNIALHIFSKEARERYDLDCLWAVGPQLDPEFNKKDIIVEMLEKNTYYLSDLKPAS